MNVTINGIEMSDRPLDIDLREEFGRQNALAADAIQQIVGFQSGRHGNGGLFYVAFHLAQ